MNAKEVINDIRKAINHDKKQGLEVFSLTDLSNYIDVLEKHIDEPQELDRAQPELRIASFNAELERNLAHYNAQQNLANTMLRSVITAGQAALKSAILINGGAAVALLAFIGRIWNQTPEVYNYQNLKCSLISFTFGVLFAAVASGGTYLTQYIYASGNKFWGNILNYAVILLVVLSYFLFAYGAFEAYWSLQIIKPSI